MHPGGILSLRSLTRGFSLSLMKNPAIFYMEKGGGLQGSIHGTPSHQPTRKDSVGSTVFLIIGVVLMLFGLAVSVLFWVPSLVNRPKLKKTLGRNYPLIFFVYVANGPLLALVGLFLFLVFGGS